MHPLLRPRVRAASAAFLAVSAGVWPGDIHAQEGCRFGDEARSLKSVTVPNAGRITYISVAHFVCADGVEIRADSAVAYSRDNYSHLIGDVRFWDGGRYLTADEARYWTRQQRLQAQGNLFVRDTVQGSVIENGELVYLRQSDTRTQEQMTVRTWVDGVRPTATLYMKNAPADTADAPQDSAQAAPDSAVAAPEEAGPGADTATAPADTATTPYLVEGDEILLHGQSYFRAVGLTRQVRIDRDSLVAFSDTAEYDQVAGRILLDGNARVEGSTYELTGRTVNIGVPGGEIREVRALRDAVLTGDELRLTAPLITMYLSQGDLHRLVAVPFDVDELDGAGEEAVDSALLARPVAVAEDFRLTADSLDVLTPGQELERIFAAGGARGESTARDSLNVDVLPEVALRDWLEGDTVIATFVRREGVDPEADTAAAEYRLDRIVAKVDARSLYRLLPSDSTVRPGVDPPAVHYVTGSRITIVMREGEVENMDVLGPTQGWHLEPLRARPDSALPDSLRPDTASADTGGARPGTAPAPEGGVGRGGDPGVPVPGIPSSTPGEPAAVALTDTRVVRDHRRSGAPGGMP